MSVRPNVEISDLEYFIKYKAGNKLYYCPNPGNAGDSAIATSTYNLFDQAGIQYNHIEWDTSTDLSGKSVVYGGGGNLTKNYQQARHFIQSHHEEARKLILFPHTIQGHADLLRQLGPNVCLICRERRSFAWAREKTEGPSVYLADDLAFRLDTETALRKEPFLGAWGLKMMSKTLGRSVSNSLLTRFGIEPSGPASIKKAVEISSKVLSSLAGNRSVLYALRTDSERTTKSLPPFNIDVSSIFSYGVAPPSVARRATVGMLSFFNCYERIVTNRLHGCILAALLGKNIDFYANSYFKNKEVYKYSIKDRFPKVQWKGKF